MTAATAGNGVIQSGGSLRAHNLSAVVCALLGTVDAGTARMLHVSGIRDVTLS
jgi:hypothetical protein